MNLPRVAFPQSYTRGNVSTKPGLSGKYEKLSGAFSRSIYRARWSRPADAPAHRLFIDLVVNIAQMLDYRGLSNYRYAAL